MMKVHVMVPTEIEIKTIYIRLPVKYGTDDMPEDFPFRKGDRWGINVDIDSGTIADWPAGVDYDLYMKVMDGGSYFLYDPNGMVVADIIENYVPHGVVPGEYGDYVHLKIVGGRITNWPKRPDISAFFPGEEE